FRLADGILQHRGLTSAQARRKTRITIGFRIIPNPEINAAVARKKNWIPRNDKIVNPTRRSAEDETAKKNSAAHSRSSYPAVVVLQLENQRHQNQRNDGKNRGDSRRGKADQ